jgi:uncharacterized membrane protein
MSLYHVKLYVVSLIAFLGIDAVWLRLMYPTFYRSRIGFLMAPDLKLTAALVFYLLFVAGLLVFVIVPGLAEGSSGTTLARAALFGLVAYGTHDLTSLAAFKGWPLSVTVVDMLWGASVSVLVSLVGLRFGKRIGRPGT